MVVFQRLSVIFFSLYTSTLANKIFLGSPNMKQTDILWFFAWAIIFL